MQKKFAEFWTDVDVPLHRFDNDEHYREYAKELSLLFKGRQLGAVLELGCGNGAFYPYLGFDKSTDYFGVDFSPAMIRRFKLKYSDVELHCQDASTFIVDKRFDLIYSNAMIQNFDNIMLEQLFFNAHQMLAEDGFFICASYPTGALKRAYYSGEADSDPKNSHPIKSLIMSLLRPDRSMGRWHFNSDIAELASRHGFKCQFFGSLNYLYRNHVVLTFK
jgi:SAM-dependent methyltransferase